MTTTPATRTASSLPYTNRAAVRQLMPHRKADWDALLARQDALHNNTVTLQEALDAANGKPDPLLARSLRAHIYAIGPVRTRDIERFEKLLDKVTDGNLWRPLGGKEWIAVDGDGPGAGKSQAVTTVALRIHREACATQGRAIGPDGNEHIPVGYVEVNSSTRSLGLMESIYHFFGFPKVPRESAQSLLNRLGEQLDQVGCRVLIIDDAHQLRQVGRDTRQLTDFLKSLLTGIPVTLVGVGNQLGKSALLRTSDDNQYIAADQLTVRHRRLVFPIYNKDEPKDRDHIRRVLRNMLKEVVVPEPECLAPAVSDEILKHLLEGSGGRVGRVIDWVKRAAVETVDSPQQLDVGLLDKVR